MCISLHYFKGLTSQKCPRRERLKLKSGFHKDKSTGTHTHTQRSKINNCRYISLIISSPWETSQQMHYSTMFLSVKLFFFFTVKVRFLYSVWVFQTLSCCLITRDQMFKGIHSFKDVIYNILLALFTNQP